MYDDSHIDVHSAHNKAKYNWENANLKKNTSQCYIKAKSRKQMGGMTIRV